MEPVEDRAQGLGAPLRIPGEFHLLEADRGELRQGALDVLGQLPPHRVELDADRAQLAPREPRQAAGAHRRGDAADPDEKLPPAEHPRLPAPCPLSTRAHSASSPPPRTRTPAPSAPCR